MSVAAKCMGNDTQRVSLCEARAAILAAVKPLPVKDVLLDAALHRAIARPIRSNDDLIPFPRSAMDGYALRSVETRDAERVPLVIPIRGASFAGDRPGALALKTVMAISTGAPLPSGADAVVPWEDVGLHDNSIVLRSTIAPQTHVFPPGEDAKRGDLLARSGQILTPGRAAMLASAGFARVPVHRRPRVAIVCTGDELVDIGATPEPGQLRNSNATMLALHAAADGAAVVMTAHVGDQMDALQHALRQAIETSDLVITTGGASTGERDFVKGALASLGARFVFTSIAMRPSKPTAFARTSEGLVAVLPGNPAAAFAAYVTLIRGAVRRMGGRTDCVPPRIRAYVESSLHGKRDRDFLVFAALRHDGSNFVARALDNQCSSLVGTSAEANALINVPLGETTFEPGSQLDLEVFDWESVPFKMENL